MGGAPSTALDQRQTRIALLTTWTTVRVVHDEFCPDIGPICQVRKEPGQLHDQRFTIGELRAVVERGLSRRLGVEAQLPLRLTKTSVLYERLDGTVFTPDYVPIHHRDETLAGLGDPWLLARFADQSGGVDVSVRMGVTLPLGTTRPNPFALADQGKVHEHLQFGTGTVDGVLMASAKKAMGRVQVQGYGQMLVVPFANGFGYRAGNRYALGLGVTFPLVGPVVASLGGDVVNEQAERWNGVVLQEGNLGRTDVLASGGLAVPLGGYRLSLSVKVPVWQHIIQMGHEAGQLTYPAIGTLAIERTWGDGP